MSRAASSSAGGPRRRRVERTVHELAMEIASCAPSATGVSFAPLLRDVRGLLGLHAVGVHRPVPAERGWAFEIEAIEGFSEARWATMRAFVAARPGRWTAYDPTLPEVEQRNVVLTLSELTAQRQHAAVVRATTTEAFASLGVQQHDQLRALVCDGPRLLGWFGGFREERFDEPDRERFAVLVPAVRSALRADALAREAALLRDALATSLALIDDPAFVIDARGRVRHASGRGAATLDRRPRTREVLADVARGARPAGAVVEPLDDGRSALVVLRTPGPDPSSRLALARRAWGLTPRQTDTLGHVVRGASNKAIAGELGCSEGNVESHVTQLLRKAGVDARAALVTRFWTL